MANDGRALAKDEAAPQAPTDRGIRDWKDKMKDLENLLGAFGNQHLAEAILGCDRQTKSLTAQQAEQVASLVGSFKSWKLGKSDPTGHVGRRFRANVCARLTEQFEKRGLTAPSHEEIFSLLVRGSYSQFHNKCIPDDQREAVVLPRDVERAELTPIQENVAPTRTAGEPKLSQPTPAAAALNAAARSSYHPVWVHRNTRYETPKDGILRGRIDQKLHYLTPDAADHWRGVIDADGYRQYEECKAALRTFSSGKLWREFVQVEGADGAVLLGAGAPHKDFIILKSLAELASANSAIHYALVDYSFYMLDSSFQAVDRMLTSSGLHDRVQLTPVMHDFLDLRSAEKLRLGDRRVAWFILGGTIGNINERQFLRSVASVASEGDLLVIGAETVELGAAEVVEEALAKKYQLPEIREFLRPALQAVWHELKLSGLIDEALSQLKPHVVSGIDNEHSVVEGTKTVEVAMTVKGRRMILLTSTRYDDEPLQQFAKRFGFISEAPVVSDLNPQYKLFPFRFIPTAAT